MTTALPANCSEKARACVRTASDQPDCAGVTRSHSVPGKLSSARDGSNRASAHEKIKTQAIRPIFIGPPYSEASLQLYLGPNQDARMTARAAHCANMDLCKRPLHGT